ncbi:hypothetical protein [Escherichia coli]|uniref:hypothetical protein n=9 Tax=Pseudomonadota TaxID=1224 RepID=UPI0024DEDB1B|nr:hypothetical protein [Escherichia coli]MDK2518407.1 hypothetical protein [Escherichia coli]
MMSLWDALRMNMMISYQELVRTFLRNNGNGCANLYLEVLLQGTSTPSLHQYRIAPDTRHPDINLIKAHLDEGFQQAKSEGLKVEISDYKERLYLYIRTPGNNLMQYSGCREK